MVTPGKREEQSISVTLHETPDQIHTGPMSCRMLRLRVSAHSRAREQASAVDIFGPCSPAPAGARACNHMASGFQGHGCYFPQRYKASSHHQLDPRPISRQCILNAPLSHPCGSATALLSVPSTIRYRKTVLNCSHHYTRFFQQFDSSRGKW